MSMWQNLAARFKPGMPFRSDGMHAIVISTEMQTWAKAVAATHFDTTFRLDMRMLGSRNIHPAPFITGFLVYGTNRNFEPFCLPQLMRHLPSLHEVEITVSPLVLPKMQVRFIRRMSASMDRWPRILEELKSVKISYRFGNFPLALFGANSLHTFMTASRQFSSLARDLTKLCV
ncbi:hypothetical protein ACHAPU_006999 [Fusarium lateritium]